MKIRTLVGGAAGGVLAILLVAFGIAQFGVPGGAGETETLKEWESIKNPQEEAVVDGRRSEHFQIVGDTLSGDVADLDGQLRGVTDTFVETNAFVAEVLDGDTVDVVFDDGMRARIRMLGVNTPETVDPRKPVECFGKEASEFTKNLLTDTRVQLEEDPQADERDMYGRLLRNIITEQGTDVSATLVAEGYAYAYTSFPMDPVRKKQLTDLEAEAKEGARGLWSAACQDS